MDKRFIRRDDLVQYILNRNIPVKERMALLDHVPPTDKLYEQYCDALDKDRFVKMTDPRFHVIQDETGCCEIVSKVVSNCVGGTVDLEKSHFPSEVSRRIDIERQNIDKNASLILNVSEPLSVLKNDVGVKDVVNLDETYLDLDDREHEEKKKDDSDTNGSFVSTEPMSDWLEIESLDLSLGESDESGDIDKIICNKRDFSTIKIRKREYRRCLCQKRCLHYYAQTDINGIRMIKGLGKKRDWKHALHMFVNKVMCRSFRSFFSEDSKLKFHDFIKYDSPYKCSGRACLRCRSEETFDLLKLSEFLQAKNVTYTLSDKVELRFPRVDFIVDPQLYASGHFSGISRTYRWYSVDRMRFYFSCDNRVSDLKFAFSPYFMDDRSFAKVPGLDTKEIVVEKNRSTYSIDYDLKGFIVIKSKKNFYDYIFDACSAPLDMVGIAFLVNTSHVKAVVVRIEMDVTFYAKDPALDCFL